jgi:hypothetical protein
LFFNEKEIRFTYKILSNEKKEMRFFKNEFQIKWVGDYWPNGIIHWFVIETAKEKHYFTSETGAWAWKSAETTKNICQTVIMNRRG